MPDMSDPDIPMFPWFEWSWLLWSTTARATVSNTPELTAVLMKESIWLVKLKDKERVGRK